MGELVMVFPLRKLVSCYSPLGRGWVAWLLTAGGEGGLLGYPLLGEWVDYL